ncbi:MAG: SelT/SelW/SelH family protein [Spirosomataceae bacterium]
MKPKITIEYCPKCGWLLRAAWMAQELLTTFVEEIGEVALKPSEISGAYKIFVNEEAVFDRKREGHFPEAKELKQLIRDKIAPEKSLGHADRKA